MELNVLITTQSYYTMSTGH